MTVFTPYQASGLLAANGMRGSRVTEFVAIGICESSLTSDAVSPAGAIGVWQIMPFNAGIGGGSVSDLYDGLYNARVAVLMSGHGANCAAWDTAYRDIQATGRYSYLNWPERGSCAANHLLGAAVATGTGSLGFSKAPSLPGLDGSLTATIGKYQYLSGQALPGSGRYIRAITAAVAKQNIR